MCVCVRDEAKEGLRRPGDGPHYRVTCFEVTASQV